MDWQTASLIVLYHTMLLVPVFWLLRLTLWHPAAHARRLRVTVVHRPFG